MPTLISILFSGNKFNLADFHYEVLKNSAMPLSILETMVDEWITSVKQDKNNDPSKCDDTTSNAVDGFGDLIVLLICFVLNMVI